jgi:CheY-like chemotaxis protein
MTERIPPSEFVQGVKSALADLYDLPSLQRSPLLAMMQPPAPVEGAGQRLRRELVEGIEQLNPGPAAPFRAPNARSFQLLHLHYVEGLPIQESGRELGLSERQTYRDLRQAELSLAVVLWERWQPQSSRRAVELSTADSEMARWATQVAAVDVGALLQQALEAVARLASDQAVTLELLGPAAAHTLMTDVALARQVLVLVLSHAVRSAAPGQVQIIADDATAALGLRVRWTAHSERQQPLPDAGLQLAAHLGWQLEPAPGEIKLTFSPHQSPRAVLIVDDNEGLLQLLEHYLTEQKLHVLVAGDGTSGLQIARQQHPAVIILDVMMPGLDGWELLQRLRVDPVTAVIPVIVCSFIHDPELARSLGATLFLPKPVRRDEILAALRQVMAG